MATLVIEFGGSEAQATAGVLHDVVEDQGGLARLDDVRTRFGDDVADMVATLSDAAPRPGEVKPPWRERKLAYIDELRTKAEAGEPAVLMAARDKLHNAESIVADLRAPDGQPGLGVFDRFSASADQTAWYYGELLDGFRAANLPPRLMNRLEAAVAAIVGAAEQV